jgi:predicted DCC family thiol-disulfide oxidoreductase YuxK
MTPELRDACRRAVHVLLPDGRLLRAGRASLFLLRALGWPVAPLEWPPLVWLVELAYRLVAAHRPAFARWTSRSGLSGLSRRF